MHKEQDAPHGSTIIRREGLLVLLFAFSHSYFGVGTIKNVFGSLPLLPRVLAALYGAGWLFLWLGGFLLLLHRAGGLRVARIGAFLSALTHLVGYAFFGLPPVGHPLLFELSRPLSASYLFLLLGRTRLDERAGRFAPPGRLILPAAALLPWVAALIPAIAANRPLARPAGLGIFIGIFMTFWCLIPFAVLVLAASCGRAGGTTAYRSAAIGTAVAGLYAYGLIWSQNFNVFLLALLPPVLFAGQGIGSLFGMGVSKGLRRNGIESGF